MGNREYWTIGMASLGAIAASQGQMTTLPDILLGAALSGGIAFGVGSIFKSEDSNKTGTIGNSTVNRLSNFRKTAVPRLPKVDGWYRDPSGLDIWRYFENGQWTLDVSDKYKKANKTKKTAEDPEPTSSVLDSNLPHERSESSARGGDSATKSAESVQLSQRLEQIERIAELRQNDVISQQEFEKLKSEILGND
jgi:hypothetical protein